MENLKQREKANAITKKIIRSRGSFRISSSALEAKLQKHKLEPTETGIVDDKLITRSKFERLIDDWAEHCGKVAHHPNPNSNPNMYIDCYSYRRLVGMGPKILPLIREVYEPDYQKKRGTFMWGFESMHCNLVMLVKQLVGDDFQIPEEASGKIDTLKRITMEWLDSNMQRYS